MGLRLLKTRNGMDPNLVYATVRDVVDTYGRWEYSESHLDDWPNMAAINPFLGT